MTIAEDFVQQIRNVLDLPYPPPSAKFIIDDIRCAFAWSNENIGSGHFPWNDKHISQNRMPENTTKKHFFRKNIFNENLKKYLTFSEGWSSDNIIRPFVFTFTFPFYFLDFSLLSLLFYFHFYFLEWCSPDEIEGVIILLLFNWTYSILLQFYIMILNFTFQRNVHQMRMREASSCVILLFLLRIPLFLSSNGPIIRFSSFFLFAFSPVVWPIWMLSMFLLLWIGLKPQYFQKFRQCHGCPQ